MTNSPPTRQRANDLMLLFAEGTTRASGRWSPTKLSSEIRPRRSHVRGADPPSLRTPLPRSPRPVCSFAYVAVPEGRSGWDWHGRARQPITARSSFGETPAHLFSISGNHVSEEERSSLSILPSDGGGKQINQSSPSPGLPLSACLFLTGAGA